MRAIVGGLLLLLAVVGLVAMGQGPHAIDRARARECWLGHGGWVPVLLV